MEKLPPTLLRFILHFASTRKKYIYAYTTVLMILSLMHPMDAYIARYLVDTVASGNFSKTDTIYFIIIFVAYWEITNIGWRAHEYLFMKIAPYLRANIISVVSSYIMNHSHKFFQENFAGNIANKISDLSKGTTQIIDLTNILLYDFSMLFFSVFVLYTANPDFAIIFTYWLVAFLGVSIYFMKYIERYSKIFADSRSTTFGKLVDVVSNVSSIKIFAHRKFETSLLRKSLNETRSHDINFRKCEIKINYLKGFISNFLIGIMIYYLCTLYLKHEITLGDFSLILMICNNVSNELWGVTRVIGDLTEEIGVCNQALNLINRPIEITDSENAKELKVTKGEIEFKNVDFRYLLNNKLFNDLSVKLQNGQKVGLVGYSGSGKTTFINLIIRLFDIDSGEISIDGQGIKYVTQDSLRSNISYIPQDPSLFHRSLMENIRYGKLDATDQEVINAANLAHAHEFILKTEKEYDTLVGERGVKLSGGQRQRIAIARAILKDAPILILDEATSALDSHTETLIQDSLNYLMKGKTTIVIAHRLSTLLNMDRIIVFHQGKIMEDGSHGQLLSNNGLYKAEKSKVKRNTTM